jgi:hypothetical protein
VEKIKLMIDILTLSVLIIGTVLVLRQIKMNRDAKFTELWLEAEKDFVELNKLMLTDKEFRDSYRIDDPKLKGKDDKYLRKFVFYELYYSHLARVHRMFNSPLNPYHGKKGEEDAKKYWKLYIPVIKYYAKDPVFEQVHFSAKRMKTFYREFVDSVSEIIPDPKNMKHNKL